jgi:1,4-alpha-glucan branching enzyme
MATPTLATIDSIQVDLVTRNQHDNPHYALGPHKLDGKDTWAIRVYRPDTDSITVVMPDGQEVPMETPQHVDFYECEVAYSGDTFPKAYKLRVKHGDREHLEYDPYAFDEPKLSDLDTHLFAEGNHQRIYDKLGAHLTEFDGVKGVFFAVWAPNARNVSIIGDFNNWDGRRYQFARRGNGVWELFIPALGVGEIYKYEVKNQDGHIYKKSDPYGYQQEVRPDTASIVADIDNYTWNDAAWLEQRAKQDPMRQPVSVYEVHLGSWMNANFDEPGTDYLGNPIPPVAVADLKPGARFLTYKELADRLIPYVKELGFTHIEVMPIAEHPFDGSWGYQVAGYYAATSRYGSPQDLMYFIDQCHQAGIGILVDWVPGHFPKDAHGLAFFDGTHLYEHADPRKGEHTEWGTLIFNYGRNEVRNFLVSNALFWFDKYHIDGIRVDAVASMLYLDYAREPGEWLPNEYGGRENLEAADFLRQTNHVIFENFPGILSIAEESTSWPMVSWPTYVGGLGFNQKWNMGWMHDMLDYFSMDPWFRQFHQNNITFSMWYHHSENYMLALSHDEIVHGKSNIIGKIPGDEWQKFATARTLYSYMFCHPGKKTLFMSMEFGQWSEWNVWDDLEWNLLQFAPHSGLKQCLTTLNQLYRSEPALYSQDYDEPGFDWIDCNDNQHSVVSFIRRAHESDEFLVIVCNFTPQPHSHYRIGVPEAGFYTELFNSDSGDFGGSNMGNLGGKWTDEWGYHGQSHSLDLCLPPLAVVVFKLDREKTAAVLAEANSIDA